MESKKLLNKLDEIMSEQLLERIKSLEKSNAFRVQEIMELEKDQKELQDAMYKIYGDKDQGMIWDNIRQIEKQKKRLAELEIKLADLDKYTEEEIIFQNKKSETMKQRLDQLEIYIKEPDQGIFEQLNVLKKKVATLETAIYNLGGNIC